jgi:uncharacterized protein
MRILLFGATGTLGQRIMADSLDRGHEVTAVAPDPSRIQEAPGVTLRQGDVLDANSVAALADGQDVVVSAVGVGHGGDPCFPVEAARSLLTAARTGVRLMVIGCNESPEGFPSMEAVDTTDFADTWRGVARAHRDALDLYQAAPDTVDWSYFTPAAPIQVGGEARAPHHSGRVRVRVEEVAAAVLDEIERPRHRRKCFSVT